jgi:hypothetical protein
MAVKAEDQDKKSERGERVGAGNASEIQRERNQHEVENEERRVAGSSRLLHRGPSSSAYARATELVWPPCTLKFVACQVDFPLSMRRRSGSTFEDPARVVIMAIRA